MGRTVVEFHGMLAEMMISAKRQHDGREAAGLSAAERAGTVDAWRRIAHLGSMYANGAAVRGVRPDWSGFWAEGLDRTAMLKLIAGRGRLSRFAPGGEPAEVLEGDSVREWEYQLAGELVFTLGLTESPLATREAATFRRITTEHDVTIAVARAYTGVNIATLRRMVRAMDGVKPTYAYGDAPEGRGGREYAPHGLFDLITANRPTV